MTKWALKQILSWVKTFTLIQPKISWNNGLLQDLKKFVSPISASFSVSHKWILFVWKKIDHPNLSGISQTTTQNVILEHLSFRSFARICRHESRHDLRDSFRLLFLCDKIFRMGSTLLTLRFPHLHWGQNYTGLRGH